MRRVGDRLAIHRLEMTQTTVVKRPSEALLAFGRNTERFGGALRRQGEHRPLPGFVNRKDGRDLYKVAPACYNEELSGFGSPP